MIYISNIVMGLLLTAEGAPQDPTAIGEAAPAQPPIHKIRELAKGYLAQGKAEGDLDAYLAQLLPDPDESSSDPNNTLTLEQKLAIKWAAVMDAFGVNNPDQLFRSIHSPYLLERSLDALQYNLGRKTYILFQKLDNLPFTST
jgi:hypothetical protein